MIRLIFMRLIVKQHSCCYSVSSIYRMITIMFSFYFIQRLTVVYYYISRRTRKLYELGSDPLYIYVYNEICSFQALHFFSLFISLTPRIMILFPFILFYCTQQKTFIIPEIFLTGLQNTVYGLIIFLYSKRTQNGRLF